MTSRRTIFQHLTDLDQYLGQFHKSQQSIYFEKLIAETFSHILYLPFFTSDNDDPNTSHRVTWHGSINPICRANPGKQDATAYCYDFYLIIEATLKSGAKQWSQEFAQSIRHCEDFCRQTGIQANRVYALMVCSGLHTDTYRSIKSNPRQEYKLIPIKVSELTRLLQTSILAFTMRHLELRRLLNQVSEYIRTSSSLNDFQSIVDSLLASWQKDVLKVEKSAVISVKSYEVMRGISRTYSRTYIGTSEILQILQMDQAINEYLKILGDKLSLGMIEESLIQQSLASQLSSTPDGEMLFSPVPFADFKGRGLRLIKEVERINGQYP